MAEHAEGADATRQPGVWGRTAEVGVPLALLLVIFGALLGLLTWVFRRFIFDHAYRPENTLPVLLLVGVVSLLCALSVTTIVFKRLELATREAPLGLPEGSVRAIIALMLLVMFFITALFLYADLGQTKDDRTLHGMTKAFLDATPADTILSATPVGGPDTPPETQTYDLVLAGAERSSAAVDLAKQLVTTISTLVVAVAAFYFGANTVQTARSGDGNGHRGNGDNGNGSPAGEAAPAGGATTAAATGARRRRALAG